MDDPGVQISMYPQYTVYRSGRIERNDTDHIVKPLLIKGVFMAYLARKRYSVAYVVWAHFAKVKLPKRKKLGHRDGNPRNCAFDNLCLIDDPTVWTKDNYPAHETAAEDVYAMIKRYEAGETVGKIAKSLGVCNVTVYRHLNLHNIKLRGTISKGKSYV